MWSYYGSKSKIIDLYPPPKHGKIIEPFAGSARYSLKYYDRDITLVDKYDVVIGLWNFLKQASEGDIISLPELKVGQTVDDFQLSKEEKWLIGFIIKGGVESPRKAYSGVGGFWKDQKNQYKKLAAQLFKIRHWKIIQGDYKDLNNEEATWFIDPPYQFGGEYYKCSNKTIDFQELANWCKERNGQTIVCENTKADWLNFLPMRGMQGSKYKTVEAIWSNERTAFDWQQRTLFDAT